jgi:hypothetical protein
LGDARRAVAGQESLGALLQRRDQVRETRPQSQQVPMADERLFQPRNAPVVSAAPVPSSGESSSSVATPPPAPADDAAAGGGEKTGTTSRLLEAKRRARRQ